jgi:hypothetical protein
MDEIFCFDCNEHLGWASSGAPGPIYYCDSCYEADDDKS